MQTIATALNSPVDLTLVAEAFPERWPFLLNSGHSKTGGSARWSILFRRSGAEILQAREDAQGFFVRLQEALSQSAPKVPVGHLPFCGGYFVYLGYEAVGEIEPTLTLPAALDSLPTAYAAHCPAALIFDHWNDTFWLVAETQKVYDQALLEISSVLAGDLKARTATWPDVSWSIAVDHSKQFKAGVARIQDYIRAGDVFQVNLSRLWRATSDAPIEPMEVYRALMRANPAPFSGFARLPGGVIVSSSPERLVLARDGWVETRPIAGTRPRGSSADEDAALTQQLWENPKERAEHIMLIDLERNDLGRVCKSGSVEVNELMVIETYEHVHHIVSNIKGQALPTKTATDIIRAVFPGGTITGCPKVRCMEIIAELEEVGRSFYTGAMGYISHDGGMDFNILIRSMLVDDNGLTFRTGAGIVADSDPDAEVAETEAKALGLLRALGVDLDRVA